MTEREQDLERICHSALERPIAERAAFVAEACGGDGILRREAESLLARAWAAESFLETPVVADAGRALGTSRPALSDGDRLGLYTIAARLGVGGMGEVYRARDDTLGREVAIKVLPEIFTNDPERLGRFEREARLLASLNHPNIATIHGVEHAGGIHALVLELVEGETLAERLRATAERPGADAGLPLATALSIARQIAEALEAAHDKGIVHRDLKPANVMIRPDEVVKLLDFGIAKTATDDVQSRESHTTPLTVEATRTRGGAILGTTAYMSPEQARGERVDRRTDVWAFGCVLYEMLTGRRAFDGTTTSDVLARVLEHEPDFDALPSSTPDTIRRLLRRALTKDLRNRLRDIGDARLDLLEALANTSEVRGSRTGAITIAPSLPASAVAAAPSSRFGTRGQIALAVVIASVAIALVILWTPVRQPGIAPTVARFELVLPESAPLLSGGGSIRLAISPDGTHMVYPTNRGLAVRSRDNLNVRVIETRISGNPFFSSDGRWIGYVGDGLRKVAVDGGLSTALAPVGPGATATWRDDVVIVADARGLFRVAAEGGTPERLPGGALPETEQAVYPEILPGGSAVLFGVIPTRTNTPDSIATTSVSRIEALDLRTGARKIVVRGGGRPRYFQTGHLLYGVDDSIMAVSFDADRLETTGDPVQVTAQGATSFAASNEGTLIYFAGNRPNQRRLVWVDRRGREEDLGAPPDSYIYPRLSPDGTRVALDIGGPDRDVWIWNVNRRLLERFTLDPAEDLLPRWSPDGTHLMFASSRSGPPNIYIQAADRSGRPERLIESPNLQHPSGFAPDGRLIFTEMVPNRGLRDVMAFSPDTRRVEPVIATEATEANPTVSPDGRWIAYDSNESGQFEVYVRPYPNTDGGQWKVSTSGGRQALWSRNGELYYRDFGGAVMGVPLSAGPRFSPGQPVTILPANSTYTGGGAALSGRTYDLSVDGSRFLMIKEAEASRRPSIVVFQNWFEELTARVPVR